jgi:hypothetical protein
MPKISWNPMAIAERKPSSVIWSCSIAMHADGTLETDFHGETGMQIFKAGMDTLQMIERLRAEPGYDFGRGRKSEG